MASPPKPWERQGPAPVATSTLVPTAASSSATATTSTTSGPPAIPQRPASLSAAVNRNAATHVRPTVGATPTFNSSYGTAYSRPYASPYNRFGGYGGYGGYGGGMFGSYGGYGGMYGGGMYGGVNPGMPGMPGALDPNDPNSLTQRFSQSTQATFQMLEGLVGAFTGFAQMLESTYMATHSSFFAMVAVAEQFGNLRNTLGSILGIFTLLRWLRTLLARVTGRPPPADAMSLTPAAFARFEGRKSPAGPDGAPSPRPSRMPFLFFLAAAFGLPYLMNKLIKALAASQEGQQQQQQQQQQQLVPVTAQSSALAPADPASSLDPARLEFCRVKWDFGGDDDQRQRAAAGAVDLAVSKGDLVAVLAKTDPLTGGASEWWRCRARDGRIGYVPAAYLEVLTRPRPPPLAAIKSAADDTASVSSGSSAGSRPATRPVSPSTESFATTLTTTTAAAPAVSAHATKTTAAHAASVPAAPLAKKAPQPQPALAKPAAFGKEEEKWPAPAAEVPWKTQLPS